MFEPTLDLILILVNLSCALGQIMTRYDFPEAWRVILRNVRTDSNLISILVNVLDELGQIMARYDFIHATRVNFINAPTWPNFDFGQLFIWIKANNYQLWLPRAEMSDFEQCSTWLQLYLFLLLVNFWYAFGKIMTRYVFQDARFVIWLAIDLL